MLVDDPKTLASGLGVWRFGVVMKLGFRRVDGSSHCIKVRRNSHGRRDVLQSGKRIWIAQSRNNENRWGPIGMVDALPKL